MSFDALGLAEPIVRAIAEEGYTQPTPIQTAAVPVIIAGRDVIGIAQTGTGKTAAFALPLLHRLAANRTAPARKRCRVLVLSPTRELSGQIAESFRTYGRHLRVSVTLAIGGVPMGKQVRSLQAGVDVFVATPGRLLDLIQSGAVSLDAVEVLVLDEADRMLDMGFVRDIRKVVAMVPRKRQTLLFSATMPGEIARLAGEMLTNPVTVSVTPAASTVEKVTQRAVHVSRGGKPGLLAKILKSETVDRAIVFARTKHGADRVVRDLERDGIAAQALHGNKSQGQRERTLGDFRSGRVRTLVATDIAARGIDVDGISHVFNFDLPNLPESYVHRIGRTARAGAAGIAISFCSPDELPFLRAIEKLIRQTIPSDREGPAVSASEEALAAVAGEEPRKGRGRKRAQRGQNQRQPQRGQSRQPQRRQPKHEAHNGNDIGAVGFMRQARRAEVGQAR
jgi:ATP-dependent RNA helicase RhlE